MHQHAFLCTNVQMYKSGAKNSFYVIFLSAHFWPPLCNTRLKSEPQGAYRP